jgi:HSP20 family protein
MAPIVDPELQARAWRRAGESGPPTDLYETADRVVIRLAVPGVEGTTLTLTVGDDAVLVRGESAPPGAEWAGRTAVHWQEIPYGRFERRVPLPAAVDAAATRARFKNGILEITLPKQARDAARTVAIRIT